MMWTNRDRKVGHDLGHREPLQQVVHFVGGEAGGGRGQHQPQVALAEEANEASVLTDREMANALILHQSIRLLHGRRGGDRERRRCHQVVRSKNSCSFTCVVFQEPSEPLTTLNGTCTFCVLADWRKEEHIALALMIALVMKMLHVLCQ